MFSTDVFEVINLFLHQLLNLSNGFLNQILNTLFLKCLFDLFVIDFNICWNNPYISSNFVYLSLSFLQ